MGCGASQAIKSGIMMKGNAPNIIPIADPCRLVPDGCVQSPMRSRSPNTELRSGKPHGEDGTGCPPTPPVKARPTEGDNPQHRRPFHKEGAPHPLAEKFGIGQAPLPLPKAWPSP
jgi:hypothetical protein